jgi:HEAT repeat protein
LRDGAALSPLTSLLGDAEPLVREAASVSLGQLDSLRVVPRLLQVLQQDDAPQVRRVAAWALAHLDLAAASNGLAQAMGHDANAGVREMCAWALGSHGARGGRDALAELTNAMQNDASASVRESAAWAIGEVGATSVTTILGAALSKEVAPTVRATIAWTLGQANLRTAPAALLRALTDSSDAVRLRAAWALSQIGDAAAVPVLKDAFAKETNEQTRRAELRALIKAGAHSESVLTELLSSKDAELREMAVRGLAGRGLVDPWPWPSPRPRPFP